MLIALFVLVVRLSYKEKSQCVDIEGVVVSSHIVQPSFRQNWVATTGKARLQDGRVLPFYSRPGNIYEVGDIVRNECGYINQELGRTSS